MHPSIAALKNALTDNATFKDGRVQSATYKLINVLGIDLQVADYEQADAVTEAADELTEITNEVKDERDKLDEAFSEVTVDEDEDFDEED